MSHALRKPVLPETWAASLRRVRMRYGGSAWPAAAIREVARRCPRVRWTAGTALAAVVAACFFAWAFLRIVLILVFPRVPSP